MVTSFLARSAIPSTTRRSPFACRRTVDGLPGGSWTTRRSLDRDADSCSLPSTGLDRIVAGSGRRVRWKAIRSEGCGWSVAG